MKGCTVASQNSNAYVSIKGRSVIYALTSGYGNTTGLSVQTSLTAGTALETEGLQNQTVLSPLPLSNASISA